MPTYKDSSDKLHFLDNSEDAHLLPKGCLEISEEEAASLRAPTARQLADARIAVIDQELLAIDKRRVRALSDAVLLGDTSRAQTLETQASALRAERASLI